MANIQLRLNLLERGHSELKLFSFREDDQSYVEAIVPVLKAGDLCIRSGAIGRGYLHLSPSGFTTLFVKEPNFLEQLYF
ncbi:MAG: hypothetical protein K9J37_16275 [Saprospiraceae bacterium]|nr:hypothetical protein [Saprospiraceae bacterium]MCF8251471.1 hypothetical protein [Saprospiraceae bacterium]MCF8282219.1 hypothetical protein [Bacteroidales bacterium]MCF8313065.1 hypothetical protein [Saprospiraceae bacterium]MCF8441513.1 hypothetical protein [Saprospiraceae bacterium]